MYSQDLKKLKAVAPIKETIAQLLKEFSSVTYMEDIGTTPARVNRPSRALQINLKVWPAMPDEHKVFVLCHELGHAELDTSDEFAVDKYASAMYTQLGYSLSESVRALTDLLNNNNADHRERAEAQLDRAKEWDYAVNGNKKVYDPDYVHPGNPRKDEAAPDTDKCPCGCEDKGLTAQLRKPIYGLGSESKGRLFDMLADADVYDNADGGDDSHAQPMFKCNPGEKAHHCKVRMRAESKAYMRMSRGMKMQDKGSQFIQKGNAEQLLAAQGIAKPSGAAQATQIIDSVGNAATNALGAWKGGGTMPGVTPPPPKVNITLYLGIGAAAVIGLVLLLFMKK